MAFLKGTTTWGNLSSDLTKLICGEMADGQATPVTAGAADRWIREYDTTVDAIRSPASKDIASGSCSMRAGYWALTTPGPNGLGNQMAIRSTTIRTSYLTQRVCYNFYFDIANSTPNDYSTARCRIRCWDMDTGNYIRYNDAANPTAGGQMSFDGITIQIVNAPNGIVELNSHYMRQFTPTFPGGIDWWPMYPRRSAVATFQTNPPGTSGTDWDLAADVPPFGYCANSGDVSNYSQNWNRGGFGSGLGIKTAAALTGAVYALSFPIALHKARIFNRSDAPGTVGITLGRMGLDGSVYRPNQAQEVSNWLRPFQTSAQVISSAAITYWLSVKADGIIVVLSGDPGLTGKTTVGWLGTFTPYDPNYDVLPVMFNGYTVDHTGDVNPDFSERTLFSYWSLRRRLDGTEGARDWQTRWMRCDLSEYGGGWTGAAWTWDQAASAYAWGTYARYDSQSYSGSASYMILPIRQLKPHPYDARWWLYGIAYGDAQPFDNYTTPANPGTMDARQIRGVSNTRWWWLPGDGWANLDELTDNSNGSKYLLIAADYQGPGARIRIQPNVYTGGIAIAEV